MKAEVLARELRAIANRGGGFGSETEAALRSLADVLETQPDASVAKLIAKLKPRATKVAAKKSVTYDTPPEGVVAVFIERLRAAGSASEAAVILQELGRRRDAPASVPEVKEIAGRYIGAKLSFKGKAAAILAIKERLERKDWDRGVLQSISDRAKA